MREREGKFKKKMKKQRRRKQKRGNCEFVKKEF